MQEQYDLRVLPAIIIVDPNTGQKMHEWRGRIDADRFMEDVVPFLDISPADPKAGTLVSASVKQLAFQNRHAAPVDVGAAGVAGVSAEDEALNQVIAASLEDPAAVAAVHGGMPLAGGAGAGAGTSSGGGGLAAAAAVGNEDADLEAAIAASLGQLPSEAVATGAAEPSGADALMDDVAVVGTRLGGAADGDSAQQDAVASDPKGVLLPSTPPFEVSGAAWSNLLRRMARSADALPSPHQQESHIGRVS